MARQVGAIGKPGFAGCQTQALPRHRHQILRIGAVQHGEAFRQADACSFFAQQARAHAVEGAAPRQRRRRRAGGKAQRFVQQPPRPPRHFSRCAAREGQQQQALRVCPLRHQPGHARRQRQRLAGAGTGHDEQRAAGMFGRGALFGVEFGQDVHRPTV
jgi:hypothetical protein